MESKVNYNHYEQVKKIQLETHCINQKSLNELSIESIAAVSILLLKAQESGYSENEMVVILNKIVKTSMEYIAEQMTVEQVLADREKQLHEGL